LQIDSLNNLKIVRYNKEGNMSNEQNVVPSRILGIQFSILSPDEIRNSSVAEITSRDTYINNKPVIGGLFDPRMGVLEPGLVCLTDGLDYLKTPGYFGHIELAKPVYYIQYLPVVIKILRCVCFKCSKLKISKETYSNAMNYPEDARWKYVFGIASGVKRCGDETDCGCGCVQPRKIQKEGLATIVAEWKQNDGAAPITIKLTPEMVLKILKRISDEDVAFMGFSPKWSRPDWMVCQVLAVPPPPVRPSVKHDAQQRSEDDLTHIYCNIIKTNKTLQEKIDNGAPGNIIEDWATVLQYYVATQIDNKIPGVASVAQRSGRPLKSIKDRLNSKTGRMRGNLMAKRVDFSARSVITADPNISIRELGIPMKIAKNITKPVKVNERNRDFLMSLVMNGPDVHPGAKILEKKNGNSITLRYVDKSTLQLEDGDTVHRHMMDGDPILFNRQPTLHRMSMMCHIAKIMSHGDTFRMNVADTKPYNADFDGDEMNLHMPQDVEAETELRNLAAVPYQLISPANNSPIIGIYQDSMLGCHQFSRDNITFDKRRAMNILMMSTKIDENKLLELEDRVSNFELLSQILPPMSLKNKGVEVVNGRYVQGQMDKKTLGGGSTGLIQRICNDFGNSSASNFVDDIQNVVTEYLCTAGFSVGISDLLSNASTTKEIIKVIENKKNSVKDLIDQTQLGVFENNTGKTNKEEFETQVNNILNQATSESGKIGLDNLSKGNRFVTMVKAGSKGSDLNISFMISCLGQQNVDGKRIPYGFENRTLPHYTKYDDSPSARGFVESSYINGLSPQELFFHAMGGRVGLIDTAVKTSTTGYIQRRLIKGMEDLMVSYDMSVRTNKGKIIQFSYGDDNFDPIRVECQPLPLIEMSIQDIYAHYSIPDAKGRNSVLSGIYDKSTMKRHRGEVGELNDKNKLYIDMMIAMRSEVMKNIFKNKNENVVYCPVGFAYIINNIVGQLSITGSSIVDITLMEAYGMIEKGFEVLQGIRCAPPNNLFKTLYYFHLSPHSLVIVKRMNRSAIELLIETVIMTYKKAIVNPGEMVGMIAAQSIGEPTTQMTLNTFHFAGVASKSNVTRGVPRIEEILSLSSDPKNPSLTIYLKPEDEEDRERAQSIMYMLEHTRLREVISSIDICFDPNDQNTLIDEDRDTILQYYEFENIINECNEDCDIPESEKSKWIVRMELNADVMLDKNITMEDINFAIKNSYSNEISCVYSDYNADKLIFRIRMNEVVKMSSKDNSNTKSKTQPLDQSDHIYKLKKFQDELMNNIVLRGTKKIDKVIMRKIKDNMIEKNGGYEKKDIWVLDTVGSNLIDILALDFIDFSKTFSNDIIETYSIFGIEAARQAIYNELVDVIEFDGTYVNAHHLGLLCDRMTYTNKMISIFRHGINNDNIGPIAKASFEETPEMFLRAARHGELDMMHGVSANIMCGQEGAFGTNSFQVYLDMNEMQKVDEALKYDSMSQEERIESMYVKKSIADECDTENLIIQNNVNNMKTVDGGGDDDYNPGF
jgi:DNA-directed RNA polymerase II subunit RPB1